MGDQRHRRPGGSQLLGKPWRQLSGLGRAFVSNLRGQVQGGSSITQQLIKNIIIDPEERYERSYTRKIKEVIMAMEITRRYTKEQILEWYLNYNFYGNFAYGIEAASRVYFDRPASESDPGRGGDAGDDSAVSGAEPLR